LALLKIPLNWSVVFKTSNPLGVTSENDSQPEIDIHNVQMNAKLFIVDFFIFSFFKII